MFEYKKESSGQLTFVEKVIHPRYDKISPPLRYPGSKFRASKYILPHIKLNYDEYREPFFGGGAIFFKLPLVKFNWLNDIDKDLMTTYRVMADDKQREILADRVKGVKPSKDYFNWLREQIYKDELDIAFQYFVINRTAYGEL